MLVKHLAKYVSELLKNVAKQILISNTFQAMLCRPNVPTLIANEFQMFDKQCSIRSFLQALTEHNCMIFLLHYAMPKLNLQILLLKHLKIACEAMFDRLGESITLLDKQNSLIKLLKT